MANHERMAVGVAECRLTNYKLRHGARKAGRVMEFEITTTIEACKDCGFSYRSSLGFPHKCAKWTGSEPITEPIGPRDSESLFERLTRITAQRNRYREQVEVLVEALKKIRAACQDGSMIAGVIDDALAIVTEESRGED